MCGYEDEDVIEHDEDEKELVTQAVSVVESLYVQEWPKTVLLTQEDVKELIHIRAMLADLGKGAMAAKRMGLMQDEADSTLNDVLDAGLALTKLIGDETPETALLGMVRDMEKLLNIELR